MSATKVLLLTQSVKAPHLASALGPDIELEIISVLRKALGYLKKQKPAIVVAEFVYAPTYGSQVSNFEALYASLQTHSPATKLIALVDNSDLHHLDKLRGRLTIDRQLALPLNTEALINAVRELLN